MVNLSSILSAIPARLISEYDGGPNYFYLGTLSKDVRSAWSLPKETCTTCAIDSPTRILDMPPGQARTACLVRGLARAIDNDEWDRILRMTSLLPPECAMYSDELSCAMLETGVIKAIRHVLPSRLRGEHKTLPPMFRVAAANAVRKGHTEAVKYVWTRVTGDARWREAVVVAACREGDLSLIKWCSTMLINKWPSEATHELCYRGNTEALDYLHGTSLELGLHCKTGKAVLYATLGGHVETVDWVLDNIPHHVRLGLDERGVCLMVSTKGHLVLLKHLVGERGFQFSRVGCARFAKKGSGIEHWLGLQDRF